MAELPDLITILDPEPLEQNLFRGAVPQVGWRRVFGGLVVAQALSAAARTVQGMSAHSLHCYFLLGGDPSIPILYEVERIRDGGSFATRRVVAIQHGKAIFATSVSFHKPEEGLSHQTAMPEVPHPDQLPDQDEIIRTVYPLLPPGVRAYLERERPIDFRPVDYGRYLPGAKPSMTGNYWLRAKRQLPDDPVIHRAILAYASDMTLLDVALGPHGASVFSSDLMMASLDHALWFHREFRADEWLLYTQDSPSAAAGRGFSRGQFFTADGVLIASVAQEGLLRIKR